MHKAQKLYSYYEDPAMINYQKLSVDLGMHLHSFEYLRSHHSRQQDIQRLRNLYSATEKKRFNMGGVGGGDSATLSMMRNNNEIVGGGGGGSVTPRKEEVSSLNRSIFIN
jgi:hypothetical protein